MKRVDDAFRELEGSLKLGKKELGKDYAFHYGHCRDRDPDMNPLKEDARFQTLLETYAPEPAAEPKKEPAPPPKKDDGG